MANAIAAPSDRPGLLGCCPQSWPCGSGMKLDDTAHITANEQPMATDTPRPMRTVVRANVAELNLEQLMANRVNIVPIEPRRSRRRKVLEGIYSFIVAILSVVYLWVFFRQPSAVETAL